MSVIWIESKERKQFSLQSLSSCKTCAFHVLADGDVLCLAADGKQVYLYNVVLSADDFKVSVVSVWTPTKQGMVYLTMVSLLMLIGMQFINISSLISWVMQFF